MKMIWITTGLRIQRMIVKLYVALIRGADLANVGIWFFSGTKVCYKKLASTSIIFIIVYARKWFSTPKHVGLRDMS